MHKLQAAVQQNKRFVLLFIFMAFLASNFWLGSRYPSLNRKAIMGGDANLDALGFDTLLLVRDEDPLLKQIIYTTINWVDTNLTGMSFGILFAAVVISMLPLLDKRSYNSGLANTALGVLLGAPLGV